MSIYIKRIARGTALVAIAMAFQPMCTWAQTFPVRPVKIVVPFVPGGTNDFLGRLLSAQLTSSWGQPIVVENRTGAGGNIGTEYVARQPADGYTVLIAASGHVLNATFFEKLPYDPIKDFDAVSLLTKAPFVLAVSASSPATNVKELIVWAKRPMGLSYGSAGIGTPLHMAPEMLRAVTGANFLHIPYKGSGGVVPALLAGDIDFAVASATSVLPHLRGGKLRALAVVGSARASKLPDVPTVAEALPAPGYALDTWVGALVAAGTPREIIARMSRDFGRVMHDPQVIKEKLSPIDIEGVGSTPEQFTEVMLSDLKRFSKLAKEANIRPEQ
jgi:tripartite-type tricarboxylate transporter receptor subunit TctC